jgi:divalent metal cation (Fe/Co/Zn/Cd) transporter
VLTLEQSSQQLTRIKRFQWLTIGWMVVEACAALVAAWMARSPALVAFGGDSAIELVSAVVVLRRFGKESEEAEMPAARLTGLLLFALAGFVAAVSVLSLLGYSAPKPNYLGIAVLVLAAAGMPWLAREKRLLSAATGSVALRADATESALCGYLSLIALVGIGLNSLWHIKWADPAAALLIIPLVIKEGIDAMRHQACC